VTIYNKNTYKKRVHVMIYIYSKLFKEAQIINIYHALLKHFPKNVAKQFYQDIKTEIDQFNANISFENISLQGMARDGQLIFSTRILNSSPSYLIATIFHELAHLYQYRKYGRDFVLHLYTDDQSKIKENAQFLKKVENTADRFAAAKTAFYAKKYNFEFNYPMFYKRCLDSYFENHLSRIKSIVKQNKFTTIDEINDCIYNMFR